MERRNWKRGIRREGREDILVLSFLCTPNFSSPASAAINPVHPDKVGLESRAEAGAQTRLTEASNSTRTVQSVLQTVS